MPRPLHLPPLLTVGALVMKMMLVFVILGSPAPLARGIRGCGVDMMHSWVDDAWSHRPAAAETDPAGAFYAFGWAKCKAYDTRRDGIITGSRTEGTRMRRSVGAPAMPKSLFEEDEPPLCLHRATS